MSKTLLLTILSAFILMLLSCGNPTTSDDGPATGTMTDIDGNNYKTVKIGNQWWMAENLRTTKYNDGTSIPHLTDNTAWDKDTLGAYCYYDNTINADRIKKFGSLYNWYAVGTKKLAPEGWHVPNDADWDTLQNYLISNGYNWDGTTTDNKIAKSLAAKSDWTISLNSGAIGNDLTKNNSSGFLAIPGGYRDYKGFFYNIGNYGYWWSVTENDVYSACNRKLFCFLDYLHTSNDIKSYGLSVRLVKD